MEEEKNIFEKLKNKLKFSYEIGNNPNYEFFEKVFKKDFMEKNYRNYQNKRGGVDDFIINPKAESIEKNNHVYIFTFEYLLKNGLLLELSKDFLNVKVNKFQRTLENVIKGINTNNKDLDKQINDYGFELINNLSILYIKISDIKSFILGEQLYGEAKGLSENDLNNIIGKSLSVNSKNTTDIVGQYYEDSVLLYFLNHSNIDNKSILPRVLFYMKFIIFKLYKKNIYIEFIPFNYFNNDKIEGYNEIDFSFYTTKNIEIPMLYFNYQIFSYTFIYNYKDDIKITNSKNDKINFPEKTLTFFELKNDIKRTSDKKTIDSDIFIQHIKTFISKLPIYIKLYKSKNFINENCNNVEFVYFYNHNNGKFEDSIAMKNMIKSEIDNNFKDLDIDINFQIIFGSKQIQAINYYELYLENQKINIENKNINLENKKIILENQKINLENQKINLENQKIKEELNNTKNSLNMLEEELNNIKKYLPNIINKDKTFKDEKNENDGKNIRNNEKKETIELDERKMVINEEIDKLKNDFKDIKLKIFEKAITLPKIVESINEYDINMIRKLARKLNEKEYINTEDEKIIEFYALNLVNQINK